MEIVYTTETSICTANYNYSLNGAAHEHILMSRTSCEAIIYNQGECRENITVTFIIFSFFVTNSPTTVVLETSAACAGIFV